MIKVIALDLVGVLVRKKDIKLTEIESKLERNFGTNINDLDFLNKYKDYPNLIQTTKNTIKTILKFLKIMYIN